jgi:hypothetical protein
MLEAAAETTSKFLKVLTFFRTEQMTSMLVVFVTSLEANAYLPLCCLQSDSHNLKYMGIDALGRLIKINPDIAEEHQLAVIDCLEVRNVIS